ncbi:MAG: tripartite tricarboxylate transporter TctB family protein [Pseudomonadota bacterium]
MRIAEIVMAIALACLSVYIMWKSGERPSWSGEPRFANIGFGDDGAPQGGFWPFWVCVIMLISAIVVIVRAVLRLSPPSQSNEPYLDGHGIGVLIKVGVPVFLMVLLTDFISIYFAMALFLLYYTLFLGRHGLVLSLALSAVLPAWMYMFFDIAMTRNLPKGVRAIEDTIYVPMGNWFRDLDSALLGVFFLAGAAVLVAASLVRRRLAA